MSVSAYPFKGRRKARKFVLQSLYGWSITGNNLIEIEHDLLIEKRHAQFDVAYYQILLKDIPNQLTDLDLNISNYLIDLALKEIDIVELTVLRIATYEFMFCLEIPYKVIIDEALILTKKFGSIEGFKFINGVLDKMAQSLRQSEYQSKY